MNNIRKFIVMASITSMAACGGKQEAAEPVPPAAQTSASEALDRPAVINPVTSLSRRLADDGYATESGKLVDGQLTNEKDGYLLFGPYVAFDAGTYKVNMKGAVLALPPGGKVRLDVASHKGKKVHGGVDANVIAGLPTFEFTLPESVTDLEIRVRATDGALVNIESYQVEKLP